MNGLYLAPMPFPISTPLGTQPEHDVSPLTEFMPMTFDFNINALNQFLASGDLDALIAQTSATPPLESPQQQVSKPHPYPRPSDNIQLVWFTNMEEQDLEKETKMLQSVTYNHSNYDNNGHDGQSEKSETETGNIDEAWREKVGSNLVPRIFNIAGPLPSIDFLVISLSISN